MITIAPSLVTRHWGRVPSVHKTCYPALAWSIQLLAYAMPSVPVPPITLLTDMVPRCRLIAAHGLRSCPSARTQPLTATGAPSQTSTIPYHTMQGVRAASHVHLVVAELCCGTPCQLPAERWELAGKTQLQSSMKSLAIVNSCQSLKKVTSFGSQGDQPYVYGDLRKLIKLFEFIFPACFGVGKNQKACGKRPGAAPDQLELKTF